MEEALALQRLIREFEMTHQDIAEAIGRSRAAVSNLLRLLELAPRPRELLESGALQMGHARALLTLSPELQTDLAERVVADDLSVRATEKLVRSCQQVKVKPETTARPDPNVAQLEGQLSERLGAAVAIQQGTKGAGKLVISYSSLDELDGIIAHIK